MYQQPNQYELNKQACLKIMNDPGLKFGVKYEYEAYQVSYNGGYPGKKFPDFRSAMESNSWPGSFFYGVGICIFQATPAQLVALSQAFQFSPDSIAIRSDYQGNPKIVR